jgi:predicted nucleotidyltransferase
MEYEFCATKLITSRSVSPQSDSLEGTAVKAYGCTMTLDDMRRVVAPLCQEFNVRRLDAFGSVARGASVDGSDVDLLVEFREPATLAAKRFFGLLHRLEDTLGCQVDLLTISGLRNPFFRKRVLKERVLLYEG